MTETIKKILEVLEELRNKEFEDVKKALELELEIMKSKRGNESLQEVIKEKDHIISEYKEALVSFRGSKKQENKS